MNSNTFRLPAARVPARKAVAGAAAAALAVVPLALATPAHATGGDGKAEAVVLRTGLDVTLIDKTAHVPLKATLNEVRAPGSAEKTTLSVRLDGVDEGRPFQVMRADVATARATVEDGRAAAYSNLVRARVHVPGLPLLSLVEVEKATSEAVCAAGRKPVATSDVLGHVKVLGKKVTLSAGGQTRVAVPGVGEVTLDLSKTQTTSRTAAATALRLTVSVDPLDLNVAAVTGEVTLAEAACEAPDAPAKPSEKPTENPSKAPADNIAPQTGKEPEENLAETGGSSSTPYIAGGAGLLLAAGAAVIVLARRRSGSRG
ncbi:LPXTG cell wall anchor domain-containing protein [Streptomyces sp. PKU-EA00015]|uniref:SCO1860 family LAETG-anchored protein n=1 Tax=Streptomyces sp. PKU-EA00015 TaxID=2748326 RepID=UPI0015A1FF35|nr:SCO1860 family LAETG-anchored protein [Streptomyces sp. PKU-EA00015]NWF26399.1 LPXTG cell wall anchor domain-containing protein [Streptomyces sp. PKU-EA00015]